MRIPRSRVLGLAAAGLLASGLAAGTCVLPAAATQTEICNGTNTAPENPAYPCLDAWNGGPYVRSEVPGTSNENFSEQEVFGRCESGTALTTSGCPIAGIPAGYLIVQLRLSNGLCVGDLFENSSDAHAGMVTCNNPNTGFGGAYGTIFVARATSCFAADGYWDAHWSGSWPSNVGGLKVTGSGSGSQFWLNVHNSVNCLHHF